ncbi:MAG: FAD:protein FMN transferase [bacterium]|nr:FAD:protein FMN transferase [bacterium]
MKMIKNILLFLPFVFCFSGCLPGPETVFKHNFTAMGTFVEIKVYDETGRGAEYVRRAVRSAEDEIRRIERLFSLYDENSDIYRINSRGFERWVEVSPETVEMLEYAKLFCAKTGGAVDAAAGNLFDLWGFGVKGEKAIPSERAIADNLKAAGFKNVVIDRENGRIKLKNRLVKIDLGAIAKGYAVDAVVKKLAESGLENTLVNAGGDVYCAGTNGKDDGWRIGIRNPKDKRALSLSVTVKNKAVVTSGDYENFFLRDGEKYSHIIDPGAGRPVSNDITSVTVIGADARTADALATAVIVAGAEKGIKIVESENAECYIIMETPNGFLERKSKGFDIFTGYDADKKI